MNELIKYDIEKLNKCNREKIYLAGIKSHSLTWINVYKKNENKKK